MKRTIAFLMAVLMAVSVLFTVNLSAVAYGDSIFDATAISLNKTYSGTITESNTTDNFTFTLSTSGALNISAKANMQWITCRVFDEDGNELWYTNPGWNSTTQQITIGSTLYLTSGKYYINFARDSRDGKYNFTLSFTSSGESFKESKWGTNNNIYDYESISLAKTYKGMLAKNDGTDFYRFTIPTTGAVRIQSKISIEWAYCKIYDEDGNELWSHNPEWNTTSMVSTNDNTLYLTSGIYYISFSKDGDRSGNYNFSISHTSSGESFKETKFGTNNSMASANSINLNQRYKGALCLNDEKDMYKFSVSKDTKFPFIFEATSMEWIYVKLFDANGNELASYNPKWNDTSKKITINQEITLVKGTYYISVSRDGGRYGNYNFSLGAVLTAPTISSLKATAGSTSVKLTWKESANATGARVYLYDTAAKSYKAVKTTTATSYTVTGLKAGKSYKFAVKPYTSANGKTVWGKTYTVSAITLPGTPAPKATQTTSSVKLTWSKVSGATGYRVYQKVNGSWVAKKTTTGTSYTISGLKAGTQYQFAVKAYAKVGSKTVWGSYKTFTTATKPATPTIKATSSSKGVATLSWNNVAGETGYQVYYSTSKSSGYKKLSNINANTVKVYAKNLKSGRTYYFRVRAYKSAGGSYVYGAFSNIGAVKVK